MTYSCLFLYLCLLLGIRQKFYKSVWEVSENIAGRIMTRDMIRTNKLNTVSLALKISLSDQTEDGEFFLGCSSHHFVVPYNL